MFQYILKTCCGISDIVFTVQTQNKNMKSKMMLDDDAKVWRHRVIRPKEPPTTS